MNCFKCKFFVDSKNINTGLCRRYPPIAREDYQKAYWTIVRLDDWCGEYFPNKKECRRLESEVIGFIE